jgi:hypothetical protein
MRKLIPPDIHRRHSQDMIADGLPVDLAKYIWKRQALWLICMHPEDLFKVKHLKFRIEILCHTLDILGSYC